MFIPWRSDRPNGPGWTIEANGCHLWTGCRNAEGYGRVNFNGKVRAIHRVRYEREVGPIPAGLVLDHIACDNPSCCNPAHLKPSGIYANSIRGGNDFASRNRAKTHCKNGHPLEGNNLRGGKERQSGIRRCRICTNARKSAWKKARRLAKRLAKRMGV